AGCRRPRPQGQPAGHDGAVRRADLRVERVRGDAPGPAGGLSAGAAPGVEPHPPARLRDRGGRAGVGVPAALDATRGLAVRGRVVPRLRVGRGYPGMTTMLPVMDPALPDQPDVWRALTDQELRL